MEYTGLTKKAKKVITIVAVLQALVLGGLGMVAAYFSAGFWRGGYILMAAVGAAMLLWVIVVPVIRFKRYKYLILPDRLEVVEGVFWVKRTVVPIDRIHQISVSRGPVDSSFGVAKVSVLTAGSKAVMRFIELEKANEIAMHLNAKVQEKLGGKSDV